MCANGKSKRERKRGEKKGRRERLALSQSGGNTALLNPCMVIGHESGQ
jgi:hypothetical protein